MAINPALYRRLLMANQSSPDAPAVPLPPATMPPAGPQSYTVAPSPLGLGGLFGGSGVGPMLTPPTPPGVEALRRGFAEMLANRAAGPGSVFSPDYGMNQVPIVPGPLVIHPRVICYEDGTCRTVLNDDPEYPYAQYGPPGRFAGDPAGSRE